MGVLSNWPLIFFLIRTGEHFLCHKQKTLNGMLYVILSNNKIKTVKNLLVQLIRPEFRQMYRTNRMCIQSKSNNVFIIIINYRFFQKIIFIRSTTLNPISRELCDRRKISRLLPSNVNFVMFSLVAFDSNYREICGCCKHNTKQVIKGRFIRL